MNLQRTIVRGASVAAILAFVAGGHLAPRVSAQSLSYTKGQPVSPAYEGWEEDAKGAKFFVFGYMNKNWEEEIDLAIGPDNGFAPGKPDQGQPTHFLPRRNRFVFRVPVPANFTEKDELVWTVNANGKSIKAYASLRPDYKIDNVVIASETGALGAGTSSPTMRSNVAPVVKVDGSKNLTVKVGQPLAIAAIVKDDGIPKSRSQEEFEARLAQRARALAVLSGAGAAAAAAAPAAAPGAEGARGAAPAAAPPAAAAGRGFNPMLQPPTRITVGKNLGLHLSWFVYRGKGNTQFDPPQIKSWEDTRAGANSPWAPLWFAPPLSADGKVTANVTFDTPGTYTLRALADDGALTGFDDLTVTVTP